MSEEKKEQLNFTRRNFISQCTKMAVGVSLLSYSSLSLAETTDSWEDYSYCIYRCALPCTWEPACPGCRSDEPYSQLDNCTVRICVKEKELPSCAHCEELETCNKSLWVNYPGQRAFALQKQKQWNILTGSIELKDSNQDFSIYYSSKKHFFTIQNHKSIKADYQLDDLIGRTIRKGKFSTSEFQVDISDLASGNYVLCILQNNKIQYSSKVLKE